MQGLDFAAVAKTIVAPKFNWDSGLRQTDQLVKNIQKGKLSATEFFDVYKNRTNELVSQQARLSRAVAQPLGNGSTAISIPSTQQIRNLTTTTELANRKLAVQGEILKGLGTKVQDWGKNTQWAGRQMMVGMTVPFAMGAAAAGMYANKIDQAMVRVEKVVDEPLEGFRDKAMATAKEITTTVGQTMESSLAVMSELAAAGMKDDQLQTMTKLSQTLATLGDMDQQSAIKGMISIQQIYKMNTKELADAVNYLNYVEDQTPTKLQDLVDAIPIAGTQVAQLGGTLQDTTILLAAFRERGIETVEGANAIKTAMNRILVPTRQAKDIFKELTGKNLEALVKSTGGKPLETFQELSNVIMGGNVALEDQQRIISKLVGTYQSSRITALLSGLQDQNGAVAATKKISEESSAQWAARTAKSLKAITDSASGQFKIAMESFKAEFLQTGEIILRIATAIVQGATKVFSFFNNMPDFVKWIALFGVGIVALAGPITMIVGIFGNFLGTIVKVFAFFTGARTKYKSMSIDAKAAALAEDTLNKSLMTQADLTQVLIYQMDKLQRAYLETSTAAEAASLITPSSNMTPSGSPKFPGSRGYVLNDKTGEWRTNTGKAVTEEEKHWLNAQAAQAKLNDEKEKTVGKQKEVTEETGKTSRVQKAVNQESLMAVGLVTALGSAVTETGSGFSEWLNYISLGAVALSAILPILGNVKEKIQGVAAAGAISGLAGKLGDTAKGFGSKLLTGGKAAFSGLAAFATGPGGLGIGATIAGIWGITQLINAKHEEQLRQQQAIVDSTDSWMKLLGKTKVEWGQIRDESGKVKENVESIAKKFKEQMPEVVQEVSDAQGGFLDTVIEREVFKLQGQGLNKKEILDNMRALLTAAGKTKKEIEHVLGHLEVSFDFADATKDLKAFSKNTRGDIQRELTKFLDMPTSVEAGGGGYADQRSEWQDITAERIKGLFLDRLAGMSDTEKAIFAKRFVEDMNASFELTFAQLNKDADGKLGKNWKEVKAKFFDWDAEENKWVRSGDAKDAIGRGDLTHRQIESMEIMIDTEQRLTQAIARGRGVAEDKVKRMSIISDIMPYVAQGNITAADAQKAYNDAVGDAKKSGKELTKEEKEKLAALIASTFGLNAATIASNGYAKSGGKVVGSIDQQKRAMLDFMNQMTTFQGAVDDFWSTTTAGDSGFIDAMGGDPVSQAQTMVESVKGIYSGAMNDIYAAMADQAQQQWESRLQAISDSFEKRREGLQKQIESLDKEWDTRMDQTSEAYERRQKAIEQESDAQIEAIDKQVEAEQDREDARQRQFDAEKKRIERLTELANRTIDYNRALATGNLDEAARVMNNSESLTLGWGVDDAKERSSLLSKDQVDALGASKELAQKQKEVKLEALKAEEEAVRKSMEMQRDLERERLQNRLDSLSKEQQATESAERNKQEMNKRTLDIELATLKAFVPKNEQELSEHVARISSAYANYGVNLQTAGGYWGTIIGNALSNNVNRARQEMSNTAAWSAFGSSVAGAISQGAFGLSLKDFFTLIATGQPPAGWTPPGVNRQPTGSAAIARPGGRMFYHTGGLVGSNGTATQGRPGRGNSPLGGDEVPTVLQRGEFVFPRSAVELYGSEYLSKLASGAPQVKQDNAAGIGGMFGSFMGAMGHSILGLAMNNLMTWAMSQYGGGGGTGAAVDFAKAQDGKPYMWGSSGPAGYDCSGYMSAIANVLTGKDNPYSRVFSTGMVKAGQAFGPFEPGLGGPFQIGVKHGNPGHTAGTLLGVPVESTGNHVRYGKDASHATDKQFNMHFHIPDDKVAAGAAIPGMGSVSGEPGSDQVQQRVKAVAAKYGWSNGAQWIALYNLIQGESSWNPNASNPTSSARGLFQKMTSIHGPIESTVEGQAQWGLNYIRGKYGDPITDYNKWSSRKPHWYDSGGDVPPGLRMVYNGTNTTESLVTHSRTSQLIDALEVANISYRGLQGVLKSSLAPSVGPNVAGSTGEVYHINYGDINIDGSGLDRRELELAIRNGIENAKIKEKKRTGGIK